MRRPLPAACVLAAAAVLACGSEAQEPAQRDGYVALGDSYTSGNGIGEYDLDEGCARGRRAYPALVAARRPQLELNFAACSGATTGDVLASQLGGLGAGTRWVTLAIGANDAGYGRMLSACLDPGTTEGCRAEVARWRRIVRRELPLRLDGLLRAIRQRAPNATVVVLGYPRMFTRAGCPTEAAVTRPERARVNAAFDLLRDTTRARVRAAGAGVRFVDAIPRFAGHEICAADPWLHGGEASPIDAYHPNRAGHARGYAPLVLGAMR